MPQTAPPITAQLGQAVGEAQRALGRLQSEVLASAGTDFETWVTLNTIVTRRPSLDAAELEPDIKTIRRALATGLGSNDQAIQALLDRLTTDGLITRDGNRVALSEAGREIHRKVRAGGMSSTERLINGMELERVEQTVLTLRELTSRAEALLAS